MGNKYKKIFYEKYFSETNIKKSKKYFYVKYFTLKPHDLDPPIKGQRIIYFELRSSPRVGSHHS
jgi:hypothetical protein